jgi:uncharacterized membrane protein YbhN (UPF0104 family)
MTAQILTALTFVALYLADTRWRLGVLVVALAILWLGWLVFPHLVNRISKDKLQVTVNHDRQFQRWLTTTLLYLAFWILHGAGLVIMGKALCVDTDISLATGVFSFSLSWVIGFAILIVPAGLGVRELTMTSLLTNYAGLPRWQSSLISITARLTLIVAELVFVMVAVFLHFHTRLPAANDRVCGPSDGEDGTHKEL